MAAIYVNGVLSHPQAAEDTPQAAEDTPLLQWPSDRDFSGPVGGTIDDLSLVPELDASTPVLWRAYGPSLGLETDSRGQPAPQGPFSSTWLLVGGLAIVFLALRR